MKTDLFQSCGHCWVFQICWHVECSTFTASPFRIWNGSTEILSPPLALFVVMLPKAHVTLHSRMSGSRWVSHHGSYLGHEDFFLYSSVYSCHFVLISSASGKHCKIEIQKWTNFCYSSFFLIWSNNLKNNYNLKFCCWYHFKINLKNTTTRKKKPLKFSTMCF